MKVVSFFTGIGGFDRAFENVGMEIVFQCEINTFCQDVLRKHWPHIHLEGDIQNVAPHNIPKSSLWCAGFPCQDLSLANQGKRQGLGGERSGLFHQFAGLVEAINMEERPEWILIENVPGLLNSRNGNDFKVVVQSLNSLGYNIAWRVLDAKYFGTPQRRRRVYIVGSLNSNKCVEVLFSERPYRIVHRQGIGIKDNERQPMKNDFNSLYVFQHATINRKATAGPQAKGYRNDGEAYTLDSRGSSDVLCRTNMPFGWFYPGLKVFKDKDSSRFRSVGNAVNINVIEWIGKRLTEVNKVQNHSVSAENNNLYDNASIFTFDIKNDIARWANSGMVINGRCLMGNIYEHSNEYNINSLENLIDSFVPLHYFLNSTQLQSMLTRAKEHGRNLPESLEISITKQRDTFLRYPALDRLLHSKNGWVDANIEEIHINEDISENLFVRRMTPSEYERLQGFPSGWTSIAFKEIHCHLSGLPQVFHQGVQNPRQRLQGSVPLG